MAFEEGDPPVFDLLGRRKIDHSPRFTMVGCSHAFLYYMQTQVDLGNLRWSNAFLLEVLTVVLGTLYSKSGCLLHASWSEIGTSF